MSGLRVKRFMVMGLLLSSFLFVQAQRKMTREEYIDTYKELAMQDMVEFGIPASIKLAQGILESGNGNSTLARKANNHFGIKCHDWKGKSVRHDDDAKNECFRKYSSVEESYRDHSEFLKNRSRYAELFTYDIDDYKAWAKGLKKAGYATSPTYSKVLIKLIEDNGLHEYDKYVIANKDANWKNTKVAAAEYAGNRKVLFNNRVKYVFAKEGDTFETLAEELDMLDWQLPKYNETSMLTKLNEGDMVYLQPKRRKASVENKTHLVGKGDNLYSISQKYAIRLDMLQKRNQLEANQQPAEGELLFLRGHRKTKLNVVEAAKSIDIEGKERETNLEFQLDITN